MSEVLIQPLITEKMTALGEKLNRFGFIVDKSANKIQIKDAVEKLYGVNVTDVNTMIFPGKMRQRYTRTFISKGITKSFKKAIVTLADGETIDFYSNV
jgi:large subunit ribosomal protein L23